MLETKEQKQIFAGSIALILILVAISFWHRPDLIVQNNTFTKQDNSDILNSKAYLDYFTAANIDQKASKELFQTIITREEIKKEVEKTLQVDQKILPPAIEDSKIKVSANNSDKAVTEYLTRSISEVYTFSTSTAYLAQDIFNKDFKSADQVKSKLKDVTAHLYSLSVPKDSVVIHKALITAYAAYDNLLNAAKKFNPEDINQNDAVWPEVYKNYAITNDIAKIYANELAKLAQKHKISFVPIKYFAENGHEKPVGSIFIPQAQAFLGIGDVVFNTTIGDIPSLVMDGVKEGIQTAFLNFETSMLNKLITKIEQNYKIANFLYYTDALVSGQYANDYLNKYVNDPLDRNIVKQFIPQFNCGKNPDLKSLFQAKANQYLGFNPATLDLNDPNYYQKMARVGDAMSSPGGWQVYYQDLASQTQSKAQKSAEQELTSSGLKTPRSTIQSLITSSNSSVVSAQRASFTALLQLGASNSRSIIVSVVAKLTETLVNQFVFQGATSDSGNIGVLKEQSTCVATAIINPVLPVPTSQYTPPPAPPTLEEAASQNCLNLGLPADCSQSNPTQSQDASMCGCQTDVRGDTIPGSCNNQLSTQVSCP